MEGTLPVAVIGGGPIGLAAAARLHERGLPFVVFEAGDVAAASVRAWGHVRLFSAWRELIDPAARRLLEVDGWIAPDPDVAPYGRELVADYLEPLAKHPAIAGSLELGARVRAVTRIGRDKLRTDARESAPFVLVVERDGATRRVLARAVIDASGTWDRANPLGADGLSGDGEDAAVDRIAYRIPDVRGAERGRYAGRRVAVVGAGHSAANALLDLVALARDEPATRVAWLLRRTPDRAYGGGSADALPGRGTLGAAVRAAVESGALEVVTGFAAEAVERDAGGVTLLGAGRRVGPFDEVVVATGFRPDLSLLAELRLELDPIVEAPVRLAPLIDPNVHSCGTVPPHGASELAHPEPDLYVVGMKSYGRAPTFLLLTGYEQVRSVVAAIAGDAAAAAAVELELPETGVCSAGGPRVEAGESLAAVGCCG